MNFKTTFVLLIALVIIGVGLWLAAPQLEQADRETAASEPEAAAVAIFETTPETGEILRVELARPDRETFVFERLQGADEPAGGKWQMVAPLEVPVEGHTVRGLINAVVNLESRSTFAPGAAGQPDAAGAGLAPPVATITLVDEFDKTWTLEVGEPVIMSSDTYVRAADADVIHIAKRDLKPLVAKELDEYRAKRLVDLKIDDAAHVHIEHDGVTYDLSRTDGEQWVINEPVRAHADREKVRGLIMRFNGLRADEFVEDAPQSLASFGLEPAWLRFSVTTETEREVAPAAPADPTATQPAEPETEVVTETHGLVLGGVDIAGTKRYASPADQPWVVAINKANAERLVPDLTELRDPRVTRVKAADVTKLEIESGGDRIVLNKADGRWQGSGELEQLDDEAMRGLLEAIEDLEAVDYVNQPGPPEQYGLATPRATLTVYASGAVEPLTIRVGSKTPSGRHAHVQRAGDPTVIVASAAQADRLAVDALALRSRQIFEYTEILLRQIDIERPAMTYRLVRDGTEWTLAQPADAPVAKTPVRIFTSDLARLRARQIVGTDSFAEYGLDEPLTTITFEVLDVPGPTTQGVTEERPNIHHTLRLSRVAGVPYARKDDAPYVFELDDTVWKSLTGELIEPKLFSFDAEAIRSVRIESTGGTLMFVKQDGEWTYPADPYVDLSQKTVGDFVKEIAELRAEAFFAYRDGDLAAEQLIDPPARLIINLAGDEAVTVHMTPERPGELPRKAGIPEREQIFRLRQADVEKLMRGLDAYLKSEEPPAQQPRRMPPGMPPNLRP